MTRAASHSNKIAVTLGDPSGIGPEIIEKCLNKLPPDVAQRVVVFGDGGVLKGAIAPETELRCVTELSGADARPGEPTPGGAAAQVAYLEAAVAAAVAGEVGAIVTAPISKPQVRSVGFDFDGHTEFLASRLGAERHAMMFAGPNLRVVLATVHVPLRGVAALIKKPRIVGCIELGAQSMRRDFGIEAPRIGVVGLNPHAGDRGLFGREEIEEIAPAIEHCRAAGIDASGPLVPDAAFREAAGGRWDLLVTMYHDQALIPIKLIDFENTVNMTLGLPIVRTSPDHGVAYDIAGTGQARASSFAAAFAMADDIVARRFKTGRAGSRRSR